MKRKKVLILSYSNLERDPRVLRQIEFISKDFDVFTCGLSSSNHNHEKLFFPINYDYSISFHLNFNPFFRKFFSFFLVHPVYLFLSFFNKFRFLFYSKLILNYDKVYWDFQRKNIFNILNEYKFELIIANDILTLPLAVSLKDSLCCKLYYDAHEYAPLEYDNDEYWLKNVSPYFTFLSKKYIPRADYCTTVGQMIADKFFELTGVSFDVVYNSPVYYDLPVSSKNDDIIRCVHHGVSSPVRKIENLILAFKELGEGFHLYLLLVNNDEKYNKLIFKMAEGSNNIFFLEPIPTTEIPIFINQFDIQLIFIPPLNFNYSCGLPNKFFESIQARLMLVCGPLKEIEFLINKFDLGIVSNGFEPSDIIDSLFHLKKSDILFYKNNSNSIASSISAESIMSDVCKKLKVICS